VALRIDDELVARQLRIEVSVGGRRALQIPFEVVVGCVTQPVAPVQRQVVRYPGEQRILLADTVNLHVNEIDEHRRARVDIDGDLPVTFANFGKLGVNGGLVIAEGTER